VKTIFETNCEKGIRTEYLCIKVRGWKRRETGGWHVQLVWCHWSCREGFPNSKSHVQEAKPKWPTNWHVIILRREISNITYFKKVLLKGYISSEKHLCMSQKLSALITRIFKRTRSKFKFMMNKMISPLLEL